jgi:putative flippase GtrA
MRCMNREFIRFVCVGLVNTAGGYLLYLLLLRFLPYTVSYTLVYATGIFVSYGLNSRFVFHQPMALKKALRFPVVYAVQYVLSALMLWAAVELFAVDPRVAFLLAVALTVPVVFLLGRRIIRGGPMQGPDTDAALWGQTQGKMVKRTVGRFLPNGGLALLSIAVAVLILEGFLRLTPYGRMVGEDPLPPRDYYRSDALAGIDIRERAEKRGYRIKECEFGIWGNELGCFDEPYRGENPFILLVGDSFSWGYAPIEQNWGKRVETMTGVRVLTCGVPGYGTKGEILKARKVVQRAGRKPQILIVGHFINDFIDDYLHPRYRVEEGYPLEARGIIDFSTGTIREKTEETLREELENWQHYGVPERPRHPRWKRIKLFLNEHSVSYRLLQPPLSAFLEKLTAAEGLRQILVDKPPQALQYADLPFLSEAEFPWLATAWKDHFEQLRSLRSWAEANDIRLLVVLIPMREQVYGFLPGAASWGSDGPTRRVREFLERENIPHVDLLPVFRSHADQSPRRFLDPQKDLYWSLDGHWSPKGNRLAGLTVAGHLVERRLVTVQGETDRLRVIRKALESF